MRHSKPVHFTLSLILLVTTLAAAPVQTPIEAGSQRETTAQILARLGGQPCPNSDFTCVTLTVPLDHFNPADPRTTDVVFAVLPATGKRKGMFVTATGGPGTSGLSAADSYTAAFDPSIPKRFDIVFFDQRGVAASGELTCPDAAAAFYQTDSRAETPQQEAALKAAAQTLANDCVSEMGTPSTLPYLGTAQAVEDLETFRQLLGDQKFWLYGESYGTQYAQTYAAAHPEHLAGLMLDGTVDLTLTGVEFLTQQAQAFNDVLVLTQQACNDDPACAADSGGDALAAYDQLAKRLKRSPRTFRFPLPNGGYAKRTFSFGDLETTAAGQLYSEGDRMLFQRALAATTRGDIVPLARLLYLSLGLDPQTLDAVPDPTFSDGMYYGVECQDYSYFTGSPDQRAEKYVRAGDAIDFNIPRLASIFYGDLPCTYWPDATQNETRPAPLIADGIPTLVLGATADPATPVGNGISVHQHLANGYLITQQGGPHVIFGRGNACPDDLVTAFLVKGKVPAQRKTECEGVVADDYVAFAPVSAAAFASPLEAFESAESEINYLPEYYYWDGATQTNVGCPFGDGTMSFEPDGNNYKFTFSNCAFSRGWTMTGGGSFNPNKDRFVLEVIVRGVAYKYVRDGDKTKVTTK
ncbi:MAG: alpha/beta fold hydrolase [Chloroflexi bacterium]|nr:alpha/beta fold hydrolase [Chloroflexota bacterium]